MAGGTRLPGPHAAMARCLSRLRLVAAAASARWSRTARRRPPTAPAQSRVGARAPSPPLGWQPSRFPTDRAKAQRAFALAEQLGSVNAAATELGTTWPSLRKAFTRHRLGMPARNPHQSNSTWAAVGDNGHIGNGRRLVADGRRGATGMGCSSVELPRSVGQRGRACNATDGADVSLVGNTCIVVMPPRHRRLSLRRSPTTHQQRLLLPFPHRFNP
jgi:hypothetical protein